MIFPASASVTVGVHASFLFSCLNPKTNAFWCYYSNWTRSLWNCGHHMQCWLLGGRKLASRCAQEALYRSIQVKHCASSPLTVVHPDIVCALIVYLLKYFSPPPHSSCKFDHFLSPLLEPCRCSGWRGWTFIASVVSVFGALFFLLF